MDRKKQKSIDSILQRTVKMKSGEIIEAMPSKVIEDAQFIFQYSNCGTKCANKGALATHVKFVHLKGSQSCAAGAGSISKFVVKQQEKH